MTLITIKADSDLEQEAQMLFESFGLSLNEAVNMFLRQSVSEQAMPFRTGENFSNFSSFRTRRLFAGLSATIILRYPSLY